MASRMNKGGGIGPSEGINEGRNNKNAGGYQAKKMFNNFLESFDMSSAFANSSGKGASSMYPNRAQTVVQAKKNSLSGSGSSNNRPDALSAMKSYDQVPQNFITDSRLSSIGTTGPQSKSSNANPFKLTSTIIETIGGQPIDAKGRNVVVNRSFCYDAAGNIINGPNNQYINNPSGSFQGQNSSSLSNGLGTFNNLGNSATNMNQSFETKNRQSVGVNLTVFNSINYLTNSGGKQDTAVIQQPIANNRKSSTRISNSKNNRGQNNQQSFPPKQSATVTSSALSNSRNMIINLNNMKSQQQPLNSGGLSKAQFMQALASHNNFTTVNASNYNTIDYNNQKSNSKQYSKKGNASRSQANQQSHQQLQNSRESAKRMESAAAAVSILSSIVPSSQKQTLTYKNSSFNTTSLGSKSASKKRQSSSNSRGAIQNQPQQSFNLRRVDKMRAPSGLDYSSIDGPQEEEVTKSLAKLNNQAIRLVIKEDEDDVVVMSHTEPNEVMKPNSRNVAKKSYQTVSSVMQQQQPKVMSKGDFLKFSKQDLTGSIEIDQSSLSKNVYKNQVSSQQNKCLDKNSSIISDFSSQPLNLRESQESIQIQRFKEQEIKDLETKFTQKLKESKLDKPDARGEVILALVDDLASKNPGGYQQLLLRLKSALSLLFKEKNQEQSKDYQTLSDELTQMKKQFENQDKVMKELRKQVACYKTEITQMQKMEEYLNADNYQKLVTEYNQLYDHYKGVKSINKKLKTELKQSNERERTFLKLLKKTNEYGAQAAKLEIEYERLIKEDLRLNSGVTLENLIVDSSEKRYIQPEIIDKGRGIKIPKLDFSSIYIQREVPQQEVKNANNHKKDDESQSDSQLPEEMSSFSDEEEMVAVVNASHQHKKVTNTKKVAPQGDQFEKEKQMFKLRMLQSSNIL